MRRRAVQIEVVFFDVLPVVPFAVDQQFLCFALALWNCEDPILKERLFELTIRYSGKPLLAPAIGARARLVMAERVPALPFSL
jgi:hypothetical protein